MFVTLFGIIILFKLTQFLKAAFPIVNNPLVKSTDSIMLISLNAFSPIPVIVTPLILSGIFRLFTGLNQIPVIILPSLLTLYAMLFKELYKFNERTS